MARYGGGHEDLNEERALLGQVERGLDGLTAKEKAVRKDVEATDAAISRATPKRERLVQIQREQRQVAARQAEVSGVEAKAIDQSTEAIARNAAARERATVAARDQARAFAGARDPLLGQAHALGREGLPPSQYQMRRELGIGSQRARRLQEAIDAGYAPAPRSGGPVHDRPLSGQQAVTQADTELAAARKRYTRATNAGNEAAANEAAAARDEALARRDAAKAHLQSARSADRARAVDEQAARTAGTSRSTALARRTELIPGALGGGPQTGQYPYAPVGGPIKGQPQRLGVREVGPDPDKITRAAGAIRTETQAHQTLLQSLKEEQRLVHEQTYSQAAQARERAAGATERLTRATHFSAVEAGTASQMMRRHGTLTSEFITAALRGETTLREMGQQAVVTAGKFGAWTLAASAIYGAVGAVHQLGDGAIQSSQGVNQLQRVINDVDGDKLKGQFSDLAGEFNVPMEVATDAVYRMGRVFHNQTDAVEAARAALYSYTTGEVDVASSTENLIAIVNGFGLTAKDLTGVYDQINAAQNKFGISIGDVEQGLAKAAGTYKNAGGDLNYLLAVFVAIQKATGRSGTEIGTGIARGVNEIRKPINQARLKAQGVDVDPENFQDTLKSALQAAKKPGADLQQIASGLMGNQYARLIAPVLRDQTRLNQAIKDTSPEAAKGSAQRELARVLGGVDAQIHRIGVNLQRLGAGLAQAGLGDIPYLMLRGLNLTLDVAVKLVDIFDKLPAPLRHALTLFTQIALVMRVMRRFGGLPGIAEKANLPFLAAPDQRQKTLAVAGARMAADAADRDREAATENARKRTVQAQILSRTRDEANAEYAALGASGRMPQEGSKQRLALERQNVIINRQAEAAEEAALVAQNEANAAREMSLAATAKKAELERLSAAETVALVEAERLAYPASLNVPERRGAIVPPGRGDIFGRSGTAGAAAGLAGGGGRDVTQHIAAMERQAEALEKAPRDLNRFQRAILPVTDGMRAYGASAASGAPITRASGAVATRVAGAADRGAGAMRGAAGGLKSLGRSTLGFLRSFGPLEYGIIGLLVYSEINSLTDHLIEQQKKALDVLDKAPENTQQLNALREQTKRQNTPASGSRANIGIRLRRLTENFGGIRTLTDPNYEDPIQRENRRALEARLRAGEEARVDRLQDRARAKGGPIPLLMLDQVRRRVARDAKLREQGIISLAEFDRRMAQHAIELQTGRGNTADQVRLTRQAIAKANRNQAQDLFHRYQGAGVDEVRERLGLLNDQVSSGHAGPRTIREQGYAYRRLVDQVAGSNDPKVLAQFFADREAYFKSIEDGAKATLDVALAGAQSEGDRRDAYAQAGRTLATIPDADRTQLNADRRRLRRARRQATQHAHQLRFANTPELVSMDDLQDDPDAGAPDKDEVQKLRRKLRRDRADASKSLEAIRQDKKRLHDAIREHNEKQQELEREAFQDRQQGRDISLALAQSRTQDPIQQARLAVDSARRDLADARKHGNSRDRKAAMTKINQAEQQVDQAILARAQALDQVREAQVALATGSDPTAMAQAALQSARNTESLMRSQHADPTQILQAHAQVLQNEAALAQTTLQEAQELAGLRFQLAAARAGGSPEAMARAAQQTARYELAHAKNAKDRLQALLDLANANNQAEQVAVDAEAARYELLASMTDDPVQKAKYQVQADQNALRHAHGPTEHRRARAQLNNDRRAVRDAKLQGREDDIEFDLEMDRIGRQTAISQYQQLLRSHNLSKQQRREIMRRIKALQKEGEQEASGFGLEVGQGVKLPTIYDVRRAIGSTRRANDQGTQVNAKTNVTVNVEVTDPESAAAVYDAIDGALTTGTRSTMRNAGLSL